MANSEFREDAALDWLIEWAMGVDHHARDHYFHIIEDRADSCGCTHQEAPAIARDHANQED